MNTHILAHIYEHTYMSSFECFYFLKHKITPGVITIFNFDDRVSDHDSNVLLVNVSEHDGLSTLVLTNCFVKLLLIPLWLHFYWIETRCFIPLYPLIRFYADWNTSFHYTSLRFSAVKTFCSQFLTGCFVKLLLVPFWRGLFLKDWNTFFITPLAHLFLFYRLSNAHHFAVFDYSFWRI